jgi:nucleotide-binding universal stress UspA family protein
MSAFASVVVGVDGAEGGRDAVALARLLAGDAERLTLVHVEAVGSALTAAAEQLRAEPAAQELERLAEELRSAGTGGTVQARSVPAGTPADGLVEAARAQDADLIVVGSSRRGGLARILLGDDTRALLRCAPCAVAVAPSGRAAAAGPPGLASIAVGYDTDPAAERALALALALRPAGGTITAVHVEPPPSLGLPVASAGVYSVPARTAALQAAREVVAAVVGVDHAEARIGRVGDGLLDLATHADLLVVGLHRRSALGRLLRGSTAEDLLRELPCPLLAVPEE